MVKIMSVNFADGKMHTVCSSKCFYVISEISDYNDHKSFQYLFKKTLKWLHFYYFILLRSDMRPLSLSTLVLRYYSI